MDISELKYLFRIGRWEATSFLILLFIAMPLKYMLDIPIGVRIVGIIHGALFSLYVWGLSKAFLRYKWRLRVFILSFVAALLPFGPFIVEAKLQKSHFT